MWCINFRVWDNGPHLLTFCLHVEMPDLASAVLWLTKSLEVQFFPLEKESSYVDGNKYNSDSFFFPGFLQMQQKD